MNKDMSDDSEPRSGLNGKGLRRLLTLDVSLLADVETYGIYNDTRSLSLSRYYDTFDDNHPVQCHGLSMRT
jgi:hypothetical protein